MNFTCTNQEACPVILDSKCVIYEGENLLYIGVTTNDNYRVALEKINTTIQNLVLSGAGISQLVGDVTAMGPGIASATLATVNSTPGQYGSSTAIPKLTVDGKGRVTAITTEAVFIPSGALSFIGDVTGTGNTGSDTTLTLKTVNSNTYTTNNFLKFAVNAKGLITSATPVLSADIISALGYTPYNATNPANYISKLNLSASAPLAYDNVTGNFSIQLADATHDGYLSQTDWNTFNNKQAAGNYITNLNGEATASGPGIASVTLNNNAVTGKVLTGVNITGGSIVDTDSILTAFGKVQNQINALIGGSIYQGNWNAATNTPTLQSGVGTKGHYYIVSVPGTTNLDGITDWHLGDWAIFDGTAWQQVDNTDAVVSVNGFTGAVSLVTDNIPEGATNQYYTATRARLALGLTTTGSSGAATYDNLTGIFNIPDYSAALTGYVPTSRTLSINGTTYDLSADRSWSIASGGLSGQILAKNSDTNYDYVWIDNYADWTSTVKEYVKAGEAITKGQAVYVSGADGTNIIVSKASNATEATSSKTLGLLAQTLATNGKGYVITEGLLSGLDTSTATIGDPVWLGTNGNLIYGLVNKPYAPAHLVYIGVVVRVNLNNGEIFIQPQNGFEMDELHNVSARNPANNAILAYNTTTSLWEKNTIAGVLGYTPANDSNVVKLTGAQTIAGTKTFSNQIITDIQVVAPAFKVQNSGNTSLYTLLSTYSNAIRNVYLPDADGVIALTSDIPSLAGYVPTSRTLTINGTTYDLSADRSWTIPAGVTSFNTRTGAITLVSGDVTSALGFSPANGANYLALTGGTLTGALSGTSATFSDKVNINADQGAFRLHNTAASFVGGIGNGAWVEGATLTNVALYSVGELKFYTGGSSTNKLTIASTGAATFSSSVTANGLFTAQGAISSAPSTTGTTINGSAVIKPSDGSNAIIMGAYGTSPYGNWIQSQSTSALGTTFPLILQPNGGNVGIGTSSPVSIGGYTALTLNNATTGGILTFQQNGTNKASIYNDGSSNLYLGVNSGATIFENNGSERMRITSGGYLKASNWGSYFYSSNGFHSFDQSVSDWTAGFVNYQNSGNSYGIIINYPRNAPNNGGNEFFYCADSSGVRAIIKSNGGFVNYQANDGNLSDIRTKKDIIPLESYWDKFKAIEIVKFKYKDQTHDDYNIGVIAQQVESVAPEFVDVEGFNKDNVPEDGIPLKTIYTADLHHTTIKVLQEAMIKIETLETELTELKALIAAK